MTSLYDGGVCVIICVCVCVSYTVEVDVHYSHCWKGGHGLLAITLVS